MTIFGTNVLILISAILISVAGFLFCHQITRSARIIRFLGYKEGEVNLIVVQRITGFFIFTIISVLLISILKEKKLSDFGITLPGIRTFIWTGVLSLVLLPMSYFNARTEQNLNIYPQIRIQEWSSNLLLLSAVSWILYLLAYEILLRGFLFFHSISIAGLWPAIILNTLIYSLIHVPKGIKETLGAIPFGIVTCYLVYITGSVWVGVFSHIILALSNEWFSFLFPTTNDIKKSVEMNIFVSGATGFIGSRLAIKLANNGHIIHALYRSESKTTPLNHPNIKFFKGDILDPSSLFKAMQGCDQAYHTAAFTSAWHKDKSCIYRLNMEGTINIIDQGMNAGVKRFVCTSTVGVLGPSHNNETVDESSPPPEKYFVDYETSKAIVEKLLISIATDSHEIIIVNPSRVYGPGILSESNSVTRLIKKYLKGNWRIIPGDGRSIGNYVFIDDVVNGHILAMEKGINRERYILGGENITFNELFDILSELAGKKYKIVHVPVFFMLWISRLLLLFSYITSCKPLITPALVRKYYHNWKISSDKAQKELGYNMIDFKTGAKKTIDWLKQ